jgi:hypothetical protein
MFLPDAINFDEAFANTRQRKCQKPCYRIRLLLLCMWQCKKNAPEFEGILQNKSNLSSGVSGVSYREISCVEIPLILPARRNFIS